MSEEAEHTDTVCCFDHSSWRQAINITLVDISAIRLLVKKVYVMKVTCPILRIKQNQLQDRNMSCYY